MSEPVESWISRYLFDVLAGAAAGLGTVAAWARAYRLALEKKMADVEEDMNRRFEQVSDDNEHCYQSRLQQSQDIAVLKAEQRNTASSIQDIKVSTRDTNIKLDDLILELKRRR